MSGSSTFRLAVNSNYDKVIYGTFFGQTEARILEDDIITIYGTANGLKTYKTILGASVTIPEVSIDKIE